MRDFSKTTLHAVLPGNGGQRKAALPAVVARDLQRPVFNYLTIFLQY
ncbi:hypothetical protein [Bordetella avium]|nr:hypothetical protein [Bordetella avium]